MKKELLGMVIATLLVLSIFAVSGVLAQDTQNPSDPSFRQETSGVAVDDREDGFNWWWLLPVLLLPIGFLLFKKSEDKDTRRGDRSQMAYHDVNKRDKDKDLVNDEDML